MCKESSRYSFESKGHEEGYKTSGDISTRERSEGEESPSGPDPICWVL